MRMIAVTFNGIDTLIKKLEAPVSNMKQIPCSDWLPEWCKKMLKKKTSANIQSTWLHAWSITHIHLGEVCGRDLTHQPIIWCILPFKMRITFILTLLCGSITPCSILTAFTVKSSGVILTVQTLSRCSVAHIWIIVTLTSWTASSRQERFAKEPSRTTIVTW